MSKFSIDFDIRIKDFKFSNEFLVKGKHKVSQNWQKVRFDHSLKWDIPKDLISKDEKRITFHFKLEMKPDIGEMMFDGECILESPEQRKVSFIQQNAPQILNKFVENFLLKYSYINAENFAKEQHLPFPPAQFILKKFGIK